MKYVSRLLMLVLILTALPAIAQTTATAPTTDAAWQLHINVKGLFASPLGDMINKVIAENTDKGKEKELDVKALIDALGFDPRTAIGEVVIYGNDFEKTSATVIANLGPNRGNIEGWLLAAPGYQSEDLDENTIVHSFVAEKEDIPRMWCAMPKTSGNQNYVFVGSFNRETTVALAKELQTAGTAELAGQLTGEKFLSISVNDLSKAPIEIDQDAPGSGLIKTIQSLALSAASAQDKLSVDANITADTPARAQQINQLIVGMKAMVQLAVPDNDEEAKKLAEMLNHLSVSHAEGETSVVANFQVGYDVVQGLIDEIK